MDHIGIDVHKRESQICILAEGGELIEQRIRTEPERFAAVLGGRPRARILLEASTDHVPTPEHDRGRDLRGPAANRPAHRAWACGYGVTVNEAYLVTLLYDPEIGGEIHGIVMARPSFPWLPAPPLSHAVGEPHEASASFP